MFDGVLDTPMLLNLRQRIVDKFTKLSKTGFSMECFTGDF